MPITELQEVESSQIFAIGHDPESSTLAIRFRDYKTKGPAAMYHYRNFTAADFETFKSAGSISNHFRDCIKARPDLFPYERVSDPLPEQVQA